MMPSPLLLFILLLMPTQSADFREHQLSQTRVREAYDQKLSVVSSYFEEQHLDFNSFELYLRVFKHEQELEVWARSQGTDFILIKTYPICKSSGHLGPKRKEGDRQVPEGFYHINAFNPASKFHLSMRVNYPNASDKVLSSKTKPGGNIYLHGNCVTIGCVPITDDLIKELYVLCVEAKSKGQERIPVTFFPMRMTESNHARLLDTYGQDDVNQSLWQSLKTAYHLFEETHQLPSIRFLPDGTHEVRQ